MRKIVTIIVLMLLAGSAGACAKMLGLEQEKEDRAFEHRAHVLEGINCNQCHVGIQQTGETGPMHFPDRKSVV